MSAPPRARPEIAAYARPRASQAATAGRGQKIAAAAAAMLCVWTVYADPVASERARLLLRPLVRAVLLAPPEVKFGAASARRVQVDGQTILYVEGSLRNDGSHTLKTPALVVTLVGDDGQPLYTWKAKPAQNEMPPSAEVAYRTRLLSPPEKFQRIAVSLADAR
jgi:hypothetical protein